MNTTLRNIVATASAVLFIVGTMTIAAGVIVWIYSPAVAGAMFGAGAVVAVVGAVISAASF